MTIDEARGSIGAGVVYRTAYAPPEDGVITEVRGRLVFVRYRGDQVAKATSPEDIELLYDPIPWSEVLAEGYCCALCGCMHDTEMPTCGCDCSECGKRCKAVI